MNIGVETTDPHNHDIENVYGFPKMNKLMYSCFLNEIVGTNEPSDPKKPQTDFFRFTIKSLGD